MTAMGTVASRGSEPSARPVGDPRMSRSLLTSSSAAHLTSGAAYASLGSNRATEVAMHKVASAQQCLHCQARTAERRGVSSFQLCTGCAYDLCPGRDVARWQELYREYGYRAA